MTPGARYGVRVGVGAGIVVWALAVAGYAAAQDVAVDTLEAGRHFDRGVILYGETDYPGALVEFKRAYALAPNSAVLYNIGEADYQLQDYASALSAFTRYLTEAPPGSGHRTEVENDVEVLRSRVGHLSITTVPPGADVFVDDQPAGRTPLEDRVLVSVGHRKITASLPGGPPSMRYVDVAADDSVPVTLELSASHPDVATAVRAPEVARGDARRSPRSGAALQTLGWIATGVLAAGAATAGALALTESNELRGARNTFPVAPETLQQDSDRTRTYSILADSLATAAVVLGGVTLLSTLTWRTPARPTDRAARLRLTRVSSSGASVDFQVFF